MDRPDIRRMPKRGNPLEAQRKLLETAGSKLLLTEFVPLSLSVGRALAQDVYADINIPAYDKTFVDGYAINPQNTTEASPDKPVAFKIIGTLFPSDYPTNMQVAEDEAVYVATGAPIPSGASATVKVEETKMNGNQIEVVRHIKQGEGIIPLGDDVRQGTLLLKSGYFLRPQDLGLLASIGLVEAEVYRKPFIAILSGGDELLKQQQNSPAKIPNNYALVVAGLAEELGALAKVMRIMPDTLDLVQTRIGEALVDADVVVTIGGSSVGVKDFVPDAINRLGKPGVVVHGIALRPGAVSGFGIVNGKPIIMLPGHIGSCIAGFYLFLAPLIIQLSGAKGDGLQPTLPAELTDTVDSGPQFRLVFLNLKRSGGKLLASPAKGGSSALTTIVKSNGYSLISPHVNLTAGCVVDVHLLGRLELAKVG